MSSLLLLLDMTIAAFCVPSLSLSDGMRMFDAGDDQLDGVDANSIYIYIGIVFVSM